LFAGRYESVAGSLDYRTNTGDDLVLVDANQQRVATYAVTIDESSGSRLMHLTAGADVAGYLRVADGSRAEDVDADGNLLSFSFALNRTAAAGDDFVVLSEPSPSRPGTLLELGVRAPADFPVAIHLTSTGGGALGFQLSNLVVRNGEQAAVMVHGERASSAEKDTLLQLRLASPESPPFAVIELTVITGLKLSFEGRYSLATDNNVAAPPGTCGVDDAVFWKQTPLECEQIGSSFEHLIIEEVVLAAHEQRFLYQTGRRPRIGLAITGIRSFGPEIDLGARDPHLTTGMTLRAVTGRTSIGHLTRDGCGEAFEVLQDFALSIGSVMGLTYSIPGAPEVEARLWTRRGTAADEDVAGDLEDVEMLFPFGSHPGCWSSVTLSASECAHDLTVKELLERGAGTRSRLRAAWANWTSRHQVVAPGALFDQSFLARLFQDAFLARAANTNADPSDDIGAEAFLQFGDHDVYTLVGNLRRGVLSTPSGIPARFREFVESAPCPDPAGPDVDVDDDPYDSE
jgi:hypothetical protein